MEEAIDDLDSRLKIDGIVIIRKKIDKGGDYSEVGKQMFAMQIYFCRYCVCVLLKNAEVKTVLN